MPRSLTATEHLLQIRRVIFTNLSPIGVLSSTTAETNDSGIATVTLKSTTDGFSTVQAEVNKDVGQARDRKTMIFPRHLILHNLLQHLLL